MFKNSDIAFVDNTPKQRYMKQEMISAIKAGDELQDPEATCLKCGEELLQMFKAQGTKPFRPRDPLRECTTKIFLELCYGPVSQEDVIKMHTLELEMFRCLAQGGIFLMLDILPSLRYIIPSLQKGYRDLVKVSNDLNELGRKLTAARAAVFEKSRPHVYIDQFLSLKNKVVSDPESGFVVHTGNVHQMGLELVIGGTETMGTIIHTLLGILVHHPEIQDRAYEDIISVLGAKPPTLKDQALLPYIQAMILEVFRISSYFVFLVPRYAKKETSLNGYLIPENTIIFPNIWSLHHDERYWQNPWEFNPLRFMENGAILPLHNQVRQRMMMFGKGPRSCPAEDLSKDHLFLLITMMFQKYKFLPAEGYPKPKHDPHTYKLLFTLQTEPYYMCVQPRN